MSATAIRLADDLDRWAEDYERATGAKPDLVRFMGIEWSLKEFRAALVKLDAGSLGRV